MSCTSVTWSSGLTRSGRQDDLAILATVPSCLRRPHARTPPLRWMSRTRSRQIATRSFRARGLELRALDPAQGCQRFSHRYIEAYAAKRRMPGLAWSRCRNSSRSKRQVVEARAQEHRVLGGLGHGCHSAPRFGRVLRSQRTLNPDAGGVRPVAASSRGPARPPATARSTTIRRLCDAAPWGGSATRPSAATRSSVCTTSS